MDFNKKVILTCSFLFSITCLFAQYKQGMVGMKPSMVELMQVDSRDSSTIVYLKYTSQEVNDWSCINEKICVRVKGIYRPFHLINSYNMPLSSDAEKIHLLYEYPNQEHCFALEFEKVPNGVRFDIIEDEKDPNACNIFDVTPDTTQVSEFVDLAKIGEEYPINRIRGRYIVNNIVVQYVKAKGITLTTYAQTQKLYGKYYTIHLDLQNLSGRSVLLSLKNVNAEAYISKENRPTEVISLDVLDSYAYDKKIRNTQRWNNFWVALSEAAAATSAGYNTSYTNYSLNSSSNVNAHISSQGYATGYANGTYNAGNTYGTAHLYGSANVYGSTNVYGSSNTSLHGSSSTISYNGAAAYAAQQNAKANVMSYASAQEEIRQQLNDGYIKDNTIHNRVEYSGFFNIKYKKSNQIKVEFLIDGISFPFIYE